MLDLHVHSDFSLDSKMDMETAVLKAVSLKYKVIAFTEHVDIDFPEYGDKFDLDFIEYFEKVGSLNSKYPQIDILKAVEIGSTKDTVKDAYEYISRFSFDYIVLSNHVIYGCDPYSDNQIYLKYEKQKLYSKYLMDIYDNMQFFKDFDSIGHYDYITRYAPYKDPDIRYSELSDEFDLILLYLSKNNKALEINTATYNEKKYGRRVFDTNILKRFKELGGKYVVLGSDSHNESSIGYKLDYFRDIIASEGFDTTTYYKDRKPMKI